MREWTEDMCVRSHVMKVYRSRRGSVHSSESDSDSDLPIEEEEEWRVSALRRSAIVLNPLPTSLPTKKNLARLPRSISLILLVMTFPNPDAAPVMTITGEKEGGSVEAQVSLKDLLRSLGEGIVALS